MLIHSDLLELKKEKNIEIVEIEGITLLSIDNNFNDFLEKRKSMEDIKEKLKSTGYFFGGEVEIRDKIYIILNKK